MHKANSTRGARPNTWRKTAGLMLLFLLIAAFSILAVAQQSKTFSIESFTQLIKAANPFYLSLAIGAMLCFILFEGIGIRIICRSIGYTHKLRKDWCYASADIYFSAITPSATGGQPACAWAMMRDGIPGGTATVALLVNLVFYTLAILVIGVITVLCSPGLFFRFSGLSQTLIIIGYVLLTLLGAAFLLLLFRPGIVFRIAAGAVRLLSKVKIVRHPEAQLAGLRTAMVQYKESTKLILSNKKSMLTVFLFNLLQRTAQIGVTVLSYLAIGGKWSLIGTIGSIQAFSIVGSNCVPIPGAMGVSDYLLLDGFGTLMTDPAAVNLELLARSLSFYSMIVICGLTVFIQYLLSFKNSSQEGAL